MDGLIWFLLSAMGRLFVATRGNAAIAQLGFSLASDDRQQQLKQQQQQLRINPHKWFTDRLLGDDCLTTINADVGWNYETGGAKRQLAADGSSVTNCATPCIVFGREL
jgi:hypothetical protein